MGSDWDIEFKEQELHDRRMAREAEEKAELDRLREGYAALREGYAALRERLHQCRFNCSCSVRSDGTSCPNCRDIDNTLAKYPPLNQSPDEGR